MKPITDEQLKELVTLAAIALTPLPMTRFKASSLRFREKYRRLSFELAGDLAKELLEFYALVDISRSGSVSIETVKE